MKETVKRPTRTTLVIAHTKSHTSYNEIPSIACSQAGFDSGFCLDPARGPLLPVEPSSCLRNAHIRQVSQVRLQTKKQSVDDREFYT